MGLLRVPKGIIGNPVMADAIIGSGPAAVTGTKAAIATELDLGRLASRMTGSQKTCLKEGSCSLKGADYFPRRKRIK